MKTLYIDCSNGISGDMVRRALEEIALQYAGGPAVETMSQDVTHNHNHAHNHAHFHRSYEDVKKIISGAEEYSDEARQVAGDIYSVIAVAESTVHEKTLEEVHFHEVGRDQAITNALRIGRALDIMGLAGKKSRVMGNRIVVSTVMDGTGFVDCAHGRIPVPVPAVRAIMELCGTEYPEYKFGILNNVDTEMVTPSGLAGIVGIGAEPAEEGTGAFENILSGKGKVIASAEAKGTRDTGLDGLKMYLVER